jgi:DNA-binding winged helix-turn-helix (wHTH) protein
MRCMFDGYILDPQRYELWSKGKHVKLRPKVFEMLAYLIRHRDRVVSKDEPLEHLRPNQFIGDGTLNACLMAVCKAVGDSGQVQRRIQTFHKCGYRFVAMVLDQEHKQVTILCCAFAEATSLAARLDAKAMHHLMQAFFARVQASMERYGGSIIHYGGDDFTAPFGAPVAYEDHARWAVLAALDPRKAQGQMWQRRRCVFAKAWISCAIRVQNRWSCVPRGA